MCFFDRVASCNLTLKITKTWTWHIGKGQKQTHAQAHTSHIRFPIDCWQSGPSPRDFSSNVTLHCAYMYTLYLVLGFVRYLVSSHFPLSLLGHSPMHRVTVSSTRNQSWKTDERDKHTNRERKKERKRKTREKKGINQSCTTHVQTLHYTAAASSSVQSILENPILLSDVLFCSLYTL